MIILMSFIPIEIPILASNKLTSTFFKKREKRAWIAGNARHALTFRKSIETSVNS
jgi:hypothetical protein